MALKEKAKQVVENKGKDIKDSISGLRADVAKLSDQVRDKLKGAGSEMKETAENLTHEVKELSEKVRKLVPGKKKEEGRLPIRKETVPLKPFSSPDVYMHPLLDFHQQVKRMFDDFYRDFGMPARGWWEPSWQLGKFRQQAQYPRMDFAETDKAITVTAELPGVRKDELQVTVNDDILTIKGEKRQEKEEEKGRFHRTECYYGSFQRSFPLPCEVDSQKIDASFNNGILTITLPKTKEARRKVIKIEIK
ncbi:MAG: Hsp20/alpha crystallin family protein [Deltaproteobacteria bacterium]